MVPFFFLTKKIFLWLSFYSYKMNNSISFTPTSSNIQSQQSLPPKREHKKSSLGFSVNIIILVLLVLKACFMIYIFIDLNTDSLINNFLRILIFFICPKLILNFFFILIITFILIFLYAIRLYKNIFINKTLRSIINILILLLLITEFLISGFCLVLIPGILFNSMNFLTMKGTWASLFYPYYEVENDYTYSIEDPYLNIDSSTPPMQQQHEETEILPEYKK